MPVTVIKPTAVDASVGTPGETVVIPEQGKSWSAMFWAIVLGLAGLLVDPVANALPSVADFLAGFLPVWLHGYGQDILRGVATGAATWLLAWKARRNLNTAVEVAHEADPSTILKKPSEVKQLY